MERRRSLSQIYLLTALSIVPALAKPIVDPGLFVIQGVTSCINGTGYCMLGSDCSVDVDFLPDPDGGHCNGLRDAFTPKIDFVCCRYNPLGKATSKAPTTTINPYTITDVFSLIDEHVDQQQSNEEEFPEDFNPENVIDIVGVATDFTGIVGLITRPWTGTFPTKPTTPTTTPMTPPTPTTSAPPPSPATPLNVEHVIHVLPTESVTESSVETTENYNEIPTETTEHSGSGQENLQTTDHQEETIEAESNSPSTTEVLDVDESDDEAEAAHVTPSTQSPPSSSPSPTVLIATTSKYPIGDNIVFPDNPIVSKFPILETEALEAETESIINILGDAIIPNPFPVPLDQPGSSADSAGSSSGSEGQTPASSGSISGSVSNVPVSGGSSIDSINQPAHSDDEMAIVEQVVGSPGNVNEEHPDIYPQKPSDDYDYYTEYQDQQHLLQPINKNICGFKGFKYYIYEENSSRILGGVIASTVEWCWVAAIMERRQSGDKYICTGALIESDLVITTATCLKRLVSRDLSNFVVVLGDSNLREDLPYGIQFHRLTEVVMHPDYLTSGGAHANDVGVIRLRDHATVSDNVCLVCLAQQDAIFPTESCTVTGYGIGDVPRNLLGAVKDTVPSDGILRQMSVPILETPKCQSALHNMTGSEILAHSDSFLCAGGTDGNNACYSTMDGGSPLACEAGGRWFLAGLVSWTRDCQKHDVPNVYTQVSSYSNWLQATHLRMMGFVTHQIRLA